MNRQDSLLEEHGIESLHILKMRIHSLTLNKTVSCISALSQRSTGHYVCVANVHMCMESFDDKEFQEIVNEADLIVPDGRPLFWAQRLLGYSSSSQVRGESVMKRVCALNGRTYLNIGLYGGSSTAVLELVQSKLKLEFPGIHIVFAYSPPFRSLDDTEDSKIVNEVKESKVDVLFVGLGCPKQERWMAAHKEKLGCVMIGVGAAFDFVSGEKPTAPRTMQFFGIEWLFRLANEPRRLWRRYFFQNPRFVWYFFQQFVLGKNWP